MYETRQEKLEQSRIIGKLKKNNTLPSKTPMYWEILSQTKGNSLQRKLKIGTKEITEINQAISLLADDYTIGWDESWKKHLQNMINSEKEHNFNDVKSLEIGLIQASSILDAENVFMENILREVAFLLNDLEILLKENLNNKNSETNKIIRKETSTYLKKELEPTEFQKEVQELNNWFPNIKVHIKDKINNGAAIAETRVRQKSTKISPADIDIARKIGSNKQVIPNSTTSTQWYYSLYSSRIFTILHELTHSVLGTLDHTESMPGKALMPVEKQNLGKRKNAASTAILNKNADSWVLTILSIREKLKTLSSSS